ncbi:TPA: hypothetical protein HA246_00715 [Candidatus Woesearchaeota archaeon]|nr:hypothetical protein [Candidatus Woesearchaeota archaeon]
MPPILIAILTYFWELLKTWFSLFAAPVYNLEMLWIIIPTYLNWIFADFFQEKKGTSLGNAISNAVIILWAAVDWTRTSIRFHGAKLITGWHLAGNIFASVIVFAYGAWIVYEGIKGKNITHYIGRIRIVTYIVLMITPLVYNSDIALGKAIISMILFFPVYYYLVELIDYLLPDPESIKEDEGKSGGSSDGPGSSFDLSNTSSSSGSSELGNLGSLDNNASQNDFKDFKL